jgi:nucleoid DNA-binding protein
MDKYLIEFLKLNSTLILPGLGALTVTDEASGELMFMPYLKHDDGRLAKFISTSEGIDEQRAQIMVAQYVRDIENRLNSEGNYTIYQFGNFSKQADGNIAFARENQPQTNVSALKTEETKEAEATVVHEVPTEILVEEKEPDNNIEISEHQVEEEATYTKEDQWKDELDLPPVGYEVPKAKQPILEKTTRDKKNRRPVILVMLSIGVIGIGALLTYIMFYNSLEPVVQSSKKSEENVQVAKEETNASATDTLSESIPTEQSIKNESDEIEPTNNLSSGVYHVVVGAFAVQSNAERFLERIQSAGNSSASMHDRYGFYFIHLNDFATKEMANEGCKDAKTDFPGAWVYYYP